MPRALRFPTGDAREIERYNRAVFERFVRKVRRLPRDAAARDRGIGHSSLRKTLVHILNVHEVWMEYVIHGRTSDAELEVLFADTTRAPTNWKDFDAYSARVWAGVEAPVASLRPSDLDRVVSVFWMRGRYTVRDAVLQTTIEQAHHLGEIIGALWQDDTAPPDMTWIDVRRPRARPRTARAPARR